ncbi:GNAT family N-acetyltransferase [Undibacterium crateris]|uniref:GNAT family N-acetyltransferase n=1 Tax=Undibacterium crateris TaxID=2528175 RepID=UPI001389B363|nr:GNAT family N-acetyltransferase [Undibacterium crateris]NDI87033.1 GNAT family N-acetyltransferase [Undibacterium crateris]
MNQPSASSQQPATLHWQCLPFDQLSVHQLRQIYAARNAVFVVEQNCVYQDIDHKDPLSHHLVAWDAEQQLAAYLRIVPPGISFAEASLGRVLSSTSWRGSGIGRELLTRGITSLREIYPQAAIRIGAQAYLEKFYGSFGFIQVSELYLEDDIPHIDMLLSSE